MPWVSWLSGEPPALNTFSRELAEDRGVPLVAGMVREFRASMIIRVLPTSTRMLLMALGTPMVRTLMRDCWSRVPPQGYAAAEAEAFAAYIAAQHLDIPYLAKVLEFERANAASLVDGKRRAVHFDFDPVPSSRRSSGAFFRLTSLSG